MTIRSFVCDSNVITKTAHLVSSQKPQSVTTSSAFLLNNDSACVTVHKMASKQGLATTAAAAPWRNLWYEIFAEKMGEEETKRRLANQFKFPAPGICSSMRLQLEVFKLKIGFMMMAYKMKKRPSHPQGIGASGTARVLDTIPVVSDFFRPGRTFQVRLRHANFRIDDDASTDGRSATIQLQDEETGDRLDLFMNTGRMNFFQNIPTFLDIVNLAYETDKKLIESIVFKRPVILEGIIDYSRRAPDSFMAIHYYAMITYILVLTDGGKRHVRFRILPEDAVNKVESGLLSEEEQRQAWIHSRSKDETRSTTYVRDGYKEELAKRNIKYFLEIQVHDGAVPSDPEIFNCGVCWDDKKYPWQHLMEIVITESMADDECEKMRLNIINRPDCLILPHPESIWDYNSLAYARQQVYGPAQDRRCS